MEKHSVKKSKCHVCHDEEGLGCCSDEIFVTLHDIKRIADNLKIDVDSIAKFKKPKKDLYELWKDNEDLSGFLVNGRMLIMRGKNNECKYLSKTGCDIFSFRPGVCRLFPFWFTKSSDGKILLKLDLSETYQDDWCLICKHNYYEKDLKRALEDAGESHKRLLAYAKKYSKELDMYKTYSKDLAKGIKPSVLIEKLGI